MNTAIDDKIEELANLAATAESFAGARYARELTDLLDAPEESSSGVLGPLSKLERLVLQAIAEGKSDEEISIEMRLALTTVQAVRANIASKKSLLIGRSVSLEAEMAEIERQTVGQSHYDLARRSALLSGAALLTALSISSFVVFSEGNAKHGYFFVIAPMVANLLYFLGTLFAERKISSSEYRSKVITLVDSQRSRVSEKTAGGAAAPD